MLLGGVGIRVSFFNRIPTRLFGNFVRLEGAENARTLCLLISQQLLALELSFKFV